MEHGLLAWTMVAIVGTVGVIKNFITFGGKRFWTLMTILVGVGVAIAAINAHIVPNVIATTKVPTISKVKNL